MKKLLLILLAVFLIVSCAHKPRFSYEIVRPVAEPYDIVKWCWNSTDWEEEEYIRILPSQSCPEGTMLISVELEIDFFKNLDHYISELEIRNEVCNKGRIDKPDKSPDSLHP